MTHFAPLIIWIVVILGLGSSLGSMNETSRYIRPLLDFLFPSSTPETLTYIHGIIRKLAHIVEYAFLGFLAFRAFQILAGDRLKAAIFALVLAVAVALMDEFQQSFNPSRTSSPYDVLLDIVGASAIILLYSLLSRRRTAQTSAKTTEP